MVKAKNKKAIFFIILAVLISIITIILIKKDKEDKSIKIRLPAINLFTTSAGYIGSPYIADTIKCDIEHEEITDTLDAFDCVTYVEGVLANIIANYEKFKYNEDIINKTKNDEILDIDLQNATPKEIRKYIPIFRYKNGTPEDMTKNNCLTRNHFFTTQWLPMHKDLFKDITKDIGHTETKTSIIDYKGWFKKIHNIDITDYKTGLDKQKIKLEYIPFSEMLKITPEELGSKLPPASLIKIVMKDEETDMEKFGTNMDISHVGFLFNTYHEYFSSNPIPMVRKNIIFRHASKDKKRVFEETIHEYIKRIKVNKRLIGVMIYEIRSE